jgi:hypothetical protein
VIDRLDQGISAEEADFSTPALEMPFEDRRRWLRGWLRETAQTTLLIEASARLRDLAGLMAPIRNQFDPTRNPGEARAMIREAQRLNEKVHLFLEQRHNHLPEERIHFLDQADDRVVIGDLSTLMRQAENRLLADLVESGFFRAFYEKYSQARPSDLMPYRDPPGTAMVRVGEYDPVARLPFRKRFLSGARSVAYMPVAVLMVLGGGAVWLAADAARHGAIRLYTKLRSRRADVDRLLAMAGSGYVEGFRRLFELAESSAEVSLSLRDFKDFKLRAGVEEGRYELELLECFGRLAVDHGNWRAVAKLYEHRREYILADDLLHGISAENPLLIESIRNAGSETAQALREVAFYYQNIEDLLRRAQGL